jgi:hypothetical protein
LRARFLQEYVLESDLATKRLNELVLVLDILRPNHVKVITLRIKTHMLQLLP